MPSNTTPVTRARRPDKATTSPATASQPAAAVSHGSVVVTQPALVENHGFAAAHEREVRGGLGVRRVQDQRALVIEDRPAPVALPVIGVGKVVEKVRRVLAPAHLAFVGSGGPGKIPGGVKHVAPD